MKEDNALKTEYRSSAPAVILGLLPLCLSLLATAIVLQTAAQTREMTIFDDTVAPPIISYIHPAAWIFLLLGYAVSCAALFLALRKRGS